MFVVLFALIGSAAIAPLLPEDGWPKAGVVGGLIVFGVNEEKFRAVEAAV